MPSKRINNEIYLCQPRPNQSFSALSLQIRSEYAHQSIIISFQPVKNNFHHAIIYRAGQPYRRRRRRTLQSWQIIFQSHNRHAAAAAESAFSTQNFYPPPPPPPPPGSGDAIDGEIMLSCKP